MNKIIEIFDAFRDEAHKVGRKVGPDDLCISRQVTLLDDDREATAVVDTQRHNTLRFLQAEPRLATPDRPAILDTPTAHAFSVGDEEFVAGTAPSVAAQIIAQCRAAGAGHFAATFNRSQPPERLKEWYVKYGSQVIPQLRHAIV